ncbi:MAG: hypothetical protein KAJ55_13295 [Anaerolineales bacterium]|nr:hypothetical protein [Anaerolineales bacterium]
MDKHHPDYGKMIRPRRDCIDMAVEKKLDERRWPWECTDCLDSGVAGRGTQMTFCKCKAGNELLDEAMVESGRGLDELAVMKGIKRERSR